MVIWQEHSIFMERNTSLYEQQVVKTVKNCVPVTREPAVPQGKVTIAGETACDHPAPLPVLIGAAVCSTEEMICTK